MRVPRPLTALLGRGDAAALVVRRQAPALRWLLAAATVLTALLALYVLYELGRYNAGFDRQAEAQRRTELEVKLEHLEKDNRQLRTRLAELETIRLGRAREQAEVARAMGELQAQVARQSQELAFYRGVVSQGGTSLGVKIEQLHITAAKRPSAFIMHLSLVRSGRADGDAAGVVHVSLEGSEGSEGGAAQSLDLMQLTGGRLREIRYSFRYLQSLDEELSIPPSFKPERLVIEVQSSRHDIAPLSQTFLWTVDSLP